MPDFTTGRLERAVAWQWSAWLGGARTSLMRFDCVLLARGLFSAAAPPPSPALIYLRMECRIGKREKAHARALSIQDTVRTRKSRRGEMPAGNAAPML